MRIRGLQGLSSGNIDIDIDIDMDIDMLDFYYIGNYI
jgi:hypothetical protein